MRTRSVVALLGSTALLAGCGGPGGETAPSVPPLVSISTTPTETTPTPSETPSSPPTAKVADTLCTRMDQTLVQSALAAPAVQIQLKPAPAEFGFPSYDVCQLRLSTSASGPVLRVGTSVFPSTPADLAAARKAYEATKGEAAKVVTIGQGGFGTSRFVVFLLEGKLFKVSGPPATLAKYVVLGEEAAQQADGLPDSEPLIIRPECERGTKSAAIAMGVEAAIRRDGETEAGDIVCGWITRTRVLYSTVRRVADAEAVIAPTRKAATSQSVPLGDEGYIDTASGRGVIRVGADKIVDLVPLPAGTADKDDMVAFALAMSGLYTR
ncbi:hypothetical protein [Kribbella sp. CA-293567]|uniref:hypothetical protein n=1 Tax=Kribbella sp. CA-293567 TaxID=3002436 RepID=UPI0022DE5A60|nr:hypothetical protein [Kribbella sp. CA-293567]WBQ04876.1 hypothetical protein OX958_33590 [Kribbella sp. CA-293567]